MSPRRLLLVALGAGWLVASVGLAAAGRSRWWVYIAPETSPMTWLQSVVLVVAGCAAVLLALRARAAPEPVVARGWSVLGAGLLLLSLDERFALHERLRDRVLAPRDVGPQVLPWVAPGDVVLLVVAGVGLALVPTVWRAVRADRGAARALLSGVALSALAVAADSVDPARWGRDGERLEQTLEEAVELGAALSFLAAAALPLLTVVLAAAPQRDAAPVLPGSGTER